MTKICQMKGILWIGRLKMTFVRTSAYFGYINFFMLLMTFYSVTGHRYAPLSIFIFSAAISILIIGAIDYFIILPSDICFTNQQFTKHQNPIYDEIKVIRKLCDRIVQGDRNVIQTKPK